MFCPEWRSIRDGVAVTRVRRHCTRLINLIGKKTAGGLRDSRAVVALCSDRVLVAVAVRSPSRLFSFGKAYVCRSIFVSSHYRLIFVLCRSTYVAARPGPVLYLMRRRGRALSRGQVHAAPRRPVLAHAHRSTPMIRVAFEPHPLSSLRCVVCSPVADCCRRPCVYVVGVLNKLYFRDGFRHIS